MILLKSALNNMIDCKNKCKSSLVVTSVALAVSFLTLVALVMNSLLFTSISHTQENTFFNSFVGGVDNVEQFIEELGEDKLGFYVVYNSEKSLEHPDFAYPISSQTFYLDINRAPEYFIETATIIEGRMATGINEIIINEHSEYEIADTLTMNVYDAGRVQETIDVTVVGRNKGYNESYYSLNIKDLPHTNEGSTLGLVFKNGTKDIDLLLNKTMEKYENNPYSYLNMNQEYNYLNGFISTVPAWIYIVYIISIILVILIASISFSFTVNVFDPLFNQKDNNYEILKSIGTTKSQ